MEKEVMYVPPKVEVIHVEVEKGFATSGDLEDPIFGGNINS